MNGPELPLPQEPVALRLHARALIEEEPGRGAALLDAGSWIADPLWAHWGRALEPEGMDRDRFLQVVAGYRRELWLWVMGERTWPHTAGGLLGRVQRRVSGPGSRPGPGSRDEPAR